jgi:hypothetical protein
MDPDAPVSPPQRQCYLKSLIRKVCVEQDPLSKINIFNHGSGLSLSL